MGSTTMKKKLYVCLVFFSVIWVIGEVCQSPHKENLVTSLCAALGCAIYLGLNSDIKNKWMLKKFVGKDDVKSANT